MTLSTLPYPHPSHSSSLSSTNLSLIPNGCMRPELNFGFKKGVVFWVLIETHLSGYNFT